MSPGLLKSTHLSSHHGHWPSPLLSFQLRHTQSFWLQKFMASATSLWKSSPSWKTRDRQPVASRGSTPDAPWGSATAEALQAQGRGACSGLQSRAPRVTAMGRPLPTALLPASVPPVAAGGAAPGEEARPIRTCSSRARGRPAPRELPGTAEHHHLFHHQVPLY